MNVIRDIPGKLRRRAHPTDGWGDEHNGCAFVWVRRFPLTVIFSNGAGWDHVSVSSPIRCPTWAEMCAVRDLFWSADEWVLQFHPPEAEYVNFHPNCLHLWRPKDGKVRTPPAWMVGPRKGESLADCEAMADAVLGPLPAKIQRIEPEWL